jgi:hypothetical protein
MSPTRAEAFPADPPVTPALVAEHGLKDEEHRRIRAVAIGTVVVPGGRLRTWWRETEASWSVDHLRGIYHDAIPQRIGTFQVQEAAD